MGGSISVLLLVGSAVVGPIDGYGPWRQVDETCVQKDITAGKPDNSFTRLACSNPMPAETIAQLCEWAMREIGAHKVLDGYTMSGPNGEMFTAPAPLWRVGNLDVHCIQVPAGYRR